MTTKTFSSKSNATRDARKELGADAIPGIDFQVTAADGGRFTWAPSTVETAGQKVFGDDQVEPTREELEAADGKVDAVDIGGNAVRVDPADPLLVNGTLYPNKTRAKEARRAAEQPAPAKGKSATKAKKAAPAKAQADKGPSKTATLLEMLRRPEGITNAQIKEVTGWTKLGGFFGAAKRAGLELERARIKVGDATDTRWTVNRAA